ncbi:MAG TPA: sugar transferase [Gaiellaceae bacterium]|nr:sugar transferase [Gaiellaceae bacterium]
MSDPALAPENQDASVAQEAELRDPRLTAPVDTSAGNGHVDGHAVETLLREVPALVPLPVAPRRWSPWALAVDVAMLAAANAIFVAGDVGDAFWLPLLIAFDAIAIALMASWRGYARRLRLDVLDDVRMAVTSTAVATMAVVSIDALVNAEEPSAYGALRLWLLAGVFLALGRVTTSVVSTWSRTNLRPGGATTIVVGAGKVGHLTASRLLEHPEFGLRPVGFLDPEPMDMNGKPLPVPVLGANRDLARVVADKDVECAVLAFSSASHDAFLGLIDECERLGVRTLVVPRLFERVPANLEVTHVGGLPFLELLPTNPRSLQFAVKYLVDRIAALALLVLLAPLLVAIAAAVRISLGRPVLYRQDRVSLDGSRFTMLKFRTMESPSDDGEHEAQFDPELAPGGVEGSDRRTRVGAFLRRSSLDELPQLVNVLKGEMSLVGPRPERPEYVQYFREHVRRYDGRLRTKAGITGWAQIHRLRGQTSIADRVEWDNYYIENFSLWLDLKILLRTIPEALKGRAA